METILISGKAGHGKDTLAKFLKSTLESRGKRVLITHYGDLLKFICTSYFNWDGRKNQDGRTLLQHVGTDIIRARRPQFWVIFILDMLTLLHDQWDYAIIPDVRFPNEIEGLADLNPYHIRIIRPGYNMLTIEQQQHSSETALDNYKNVQLTVINDGTLNDLEIQAERICDIHIDKKVET